ncbi:unnamed protein product [Absidia cylindrospora]
MSFSSSVSPEWSLFLLAPLTIRLPNVQVVENPVSVNSVHPDPDTMPPPNQSFAPGPNNGVAPMEVDTMSQVMSKLNALEQRLDRK